MSATAAAESPPLASRNGCEPTGNKLERQSAESGRSLVPTNRVGAGRSRSSFAFSTPTPPLLLPTAPQEKAAFSKLPRFSSPTSTEAAADSKPSTEDSKPTTSTDMAQRKRGTLSAAADHFMRQISPQKSSVQTSPGTTVKTFIPSSGRKTTPARSTSPIGAAKSARASESNSKIPKKSLSPRQKHSKDKEKEEAS